MHFQIAPHTQPKLLRCTAGAIYDVIMDLRPESATFKQGTAVELIAANHRQLSFSHGFQILADNTEVLYQMSTPYVSTSPRDVRWNDPALQLIGVRLRGSSLPGIKRPDCTG